MFRLKARAYIGDEMTYDQKVVLPLLIENKDNWPVTFWTGLKDKNGDDIYEGDIVNLIYHWDEHLIGIHEVEWQDCGYYFPIYPCGDYAIEDKNIEIIGNKFENPELLKNTNEI